MLFLFLCLILEDTKKYLPKQEETLPQLKPLLDQKDGIDWPTAPQGSVLTILY